jgi:hypothetical protein
MRLVASDALAVSIATQVGIVHPLPIERIARAVVNWVCDGGWRIKLQNHTAVFNRPGGTIGIEKVFSIPRPDA